MVTRILQTDRQSGRACSGDVRVLLIVLFAGCPSSNGELLPIFLTLGQNCCNLVIYDPSALPLSHLLLHLAWALGPSFTPCFSSQKTSKLVSERDRERERERERGRKKVRKKREKEVSTVPVAKNWILVISLILDSKLVQCLTLKPFQINMTILKL